MAKKKIDPVAFIESVAGAVNIASSLSGKELQSITEDVLREYRIDKDSMSEWFKQMDRGIKLAKLVKDDKTYPFDKAANVKYPLITSAALQFNARAYPAICAPKEVVKVKTHGSDPEGVKAARAERVSSHMSWQLSAQIEEWEEQTDKLLVQLPIVGEMFRKVWYDPIKQRITCRIIDAGKFIVNDKVRVINDAPRCSEEIDLYPLEIAERERAGEFIEIDYDEDDNDTQKQHLFIEQHRRIDLDDDGYEEPYIVTVHKETEKVVRIVADFEPHDVNWETEQQEHVEQVMNPETQVFDLVPQIVEVPVGVKSIRRGSYFIDYQFMPGMDGGFHGTGLGLLLGDISESINSIMNMMLDAGHMSSLGGGFIGSGLRLKGGAQRFRPGEWKQIRTDGGDIQRNIVPMTFPTPDATLFQMLGMLIEAGREIASVKDIMTGDSGTKNMTATTTLALIEQGMMVFTASYKRIFRSLKKEFKLFAALNAQTVDPEHYNQFHDQPVMVSPAQDYAAADMDIEPVADPQSVTKMQQAAKAQLIMELAEKGMVDPIEASKRVIEAADIGNTEELEPKPDPMQEEMAQMQAQMEQLKLQIEGAKAQSAQTKAEADMVKAQADLANAQRPQDDNTLDYAKLQADAEATSAQMNSAAQLKQMELDHQAQLERERIASQERIAAEERLAALEMKRLDLISQQSAEGQGDNQAVGAIDGMIAAMTEQIRVMNGPKEVIRDENGRVSGVRPMAMN